MTLQPKPDVLHIRVPAHLRGRRLWRDRHRYNRLHLELETLTAAENRYWTGRLNAAYRACGCPEASLGLVSGLGAYLFYLAGTRGFSASGWAEAGIGLLVAGASSAAGKLIGIIRARATFGRSLRRLAAATSDLAVGPE
jgi:hypothetical protein